MMMRLQSVRWWWWRVAVVAGLLSAVSFVDTASGTEGDDVLGCGGAVLSPTPINFAAVEVVLLQDGEELQRTECAPHNGYYFLPIDKPGTYELHIDAPAEWNFDSRQATIAFNGESDKCSRGEDINFSFTGLDVKGQVVAEATDMGPAGVEVALHAIEEQDDGTPLIADEHLQTTLTDKQGHFTFHDVLPGTYAVRGRHERWSFSKPTQHIAVQPTRVDHPVLVLSGHDVVVHVRDHVGNGVPGAIFAISTAAERDACDSIDTTAVQAHFATMKGHVWCTAVSDATGAVIFTGVNPGQHTITGAVRDASGAVYGLHPRQQQVTVAVGGTQPLDDFVVVAAAVTGSCTTPAGDAIPGVRVRLIAHGSDGVETETGTDGRFAFSHVNPSLPYAVVASKDGLAFDPIQVTLDGFSTSMHIQPNRFKVCGRLVSASPVVGSALSTAGVRVVARSSAADRAVESVSDSSGRFCFELPPGDASFNIAPVSAAYWEPKLIDVHVTEPLMQDNDELPTFRQVVGRIRGVVRCLDKCNDDMHMSITAAGEGKKRFPVAIEQDGTASFAVDNVALEAFSVSVSKPTWCFTPKMAAVVVKPHDMTVDGQRVDSVDFEQRGYSLKITASHDVNVSISHNAHKDAEVVLVAKGKSRICLQNQGVYTITPRSCFRYNQDSFVYDTSNPQPIDLTAHAVTFTGTALLPKMCSSLTAEAVDDEGTTWPGTTAFAGKREDAFQYEFSVVVPLGINARVVLSGCRLYFSPPSTPLTLPESGCPEPLAPFHGKEGIRVSGHVDPPLAGVNVTLSTACKERRLETTQSFTTASDGKFIFGPVSDECRVQLSAEKEGYELILAEGETNTFKAIKLGALELSVATPSGEPVKGAVLTVTGGTYRKSRATRDNGTVIFKHLRPMQYFVKPLLKSFVFRPASSLVNMTAGQLVHVSLTAVRSSFSVCGRLKTPSGSIENGLKLAATSLQDGSVVRTGTANATGHFCIEDLHPNTTARVVPLLENKPTLTTRPTHMDVHVGEADVDDVKFIVIQHKSTCVVAGTALHLPLQSRSRIRAHLLLDGAIFASDFLFPATHFEFELPQPVEGSIKVQLADQQGVLVEAPVDSCEGTRVLALPVPQHQASTTRSSAVQGEQANMRVNAVLGVAACVFILATAVLRPQLARFRP
ncbi:hypothetical protein PTSG_04300 [Salpingoeca rosetta]|uniref:SD-repeat containing protein B domain-containing protein n=1 Tax=Salpingoeca rosetta (strain ATCC 50818 / BSB-021) TaxID=946362 RepID=F2U763_SALR5|nr:uncharacterized protein PTSG_04300 [Salpingoeca rosetta]EGD83695.1 hypothetical protein PTSG_04300 [Salpingoeca rosetta]|eukprot:XP_004995199.1 hypothetical protein PTSG_04300 [Salpingoeca rosetta]